MDGSRWLWPLLGFFTFWVTGTTTIAAELARQGLAIGGDPTDALASVLFSLSFLLAEITALYLVLDLSRAHREEVEVAFEPVLDHDELRLRWKPTRPSVPRMIWTLALVAVPLGVGIDLVGRVRPDFELSALAIGYAGLLAGLWLFGAAAWWRTTRRELESFATLVLHVRGGEVGLTTHALRGARREVWPLSAIAVRPVHGGLVVERCAAVRRIPLPVGAEEREQLAEWLRSAGRHAGDGLPPVPEALLRLRRTAR